MNRHALTSPWVALAWRNIVLPILFTLLFLNHFNISLHDSFFVCTFLFRLRPETILCAFFHQAPAPFRIACTSFRDSSSSCRSIRDYLADISTTSYRSATKSLAAASGQRLTLLRCLTSTSSSFMHGNTGATELVACREEAFPSVAFSHESFLLGSKLVPEVVEGFVVRAMYNMT